MLTKLQLKYKPLLNLKLKSICVLVNSSEREKPGKIKKMDQSESDGKRDGGGATTDASNGTLSQLRNSNVIYIYGIYYSVVTTLFTVSRLSLVTW